MISGVGGGPSARYKQPDVQTDTHHSDQISRSARRDGATKKIQKSSEVYGFTVESKI